MDSTTYECTFTGRQAGAIGIFHSNRVIVTVPSGPESESAARLKLYDTHEHISNLTIKPIKKP